MGSIGILMSVLKGVVLVGVCVVGVMAGVVVIGVVMIGVGVKAGVGVGTDIELFPRRIRG